MKKLFVFIFLFLQTISVFSMHDEWQNLAGRGPSGLWEWFKGKSAQEAVPPIVRALKPYLEPTANVFKFIRKHTTPGLGVAGFVLGSTGIYFIYRLIAYIKITKDLSIQVDKQRSKLLQLEKKYSTLTAKIKEKASKKDEQIIKGAPKKEDENQEPFSAGPGQEDIPKSETAKIKEKASKKDEQIIKGAPEKEDENQEPFSAGPGQEDIPKSESLPEQPLVTRQKTQREIDIDKKNKKIKKLYKREYKKFSKMQKQLTKQKNFLKKVAPSVLNTLRAGVLFGVVYAIHLAGGSIDWFIEMLLSLAK